MSAADELSVWVVYDHPTDEPDYYVARRFAGEKPTNQVMRSKDLDALRFSLERLGLVHLDRFPADEPHILEVWL